MDNQSVIELKAKLRNKIATVKRDRSKGICCQPRTLEQTVQQNMRMSNLLNQHTSRAIAKKGGFKNISAAKRQIELEGAQL